MGKPSSRASSRLDKLLAMSRALPELEVSGMERVHERGRGAGYLKFAIRKKTVAYYLDPLICQESDIDGTTSFKDAEGAFGTVTKKAQKIFFCPQRPPQGAFGAHGVPSAPCAVFCVRSDPHRAPSAPMGCLRHRPPFFCAQINVQQGSSLS